MSINQPLLNDAPIVNATIYIMRPRTKRIASISPIALFVLSLIALQVTADENVYTRARLDEGGLSKRVRKADYQAHPAGELVCRPFGLCEPCPVDEPHLTLPLDGPAQHDRANPQRTQPFCQPFGNRRLLHCKSSKESDGRSTEVPAWEACGKVVKQERQDFWEFVTANLLFLIVAMAILWARSSALATAQYRQLAAKIGIPGSGGWR